MQKIPLRTVPFSEGPDIEVRLISDEVGFRVSLGENKGFCASFFTQIDKSLTDAMLSWLKDYGRKKPSSVSFLPRQKLPEFTESVLNRMKEVPFGEIVSYSDLASLAGSPRAVRAVGTVCRLNRYPLFIPCHRVVRKGGSLGGFAFGSSIKNILLEFEEGN